MRNVILPALLLVLAFSTTAQTLSAYKTFGGVHFEYTKDTMTYVVSPRQVSNILQDDPIAFAEFKKARKQNTFAGILGFAGAGLIAVPLVSSVAGVSPDWTWAAGGAALIVGSIPLHRAYIRNTQSAVDLYNDKKTSFRFRPWLEFRANSVALVYKF